MPSAISIRQAKRVRDPELRAIHVMLAALEPLDVEARHRVMAYIGQRKGCATSSPRDEPCACEREPQEDEAPRSLAEMRDPEADHT